MKKIGIIVYIISILSIWTISTVIAYKNANRNSIPKNYISIFRGEEIEKVNSLYVYKKKSKKKNKYNYIYTIRIINIFDSTEWSEEIIEKGKVNTIKQVFNKAKQYNAYSYVKDIKTGELYTIEDYKKHLINKE